jgi:hypothetical protein
MTQGEDNQSKIQNKTQQKIKKISNIDPTKKRSLP